MVNTGERLRNIRKMRGLTLDDVSRRLDGMVTVQSISKYERGLMSPSPVIFEMLLKVYGISAETFEGRECLEFTSWNFRRPQDMSVKMEEKLKYEIKYRLEHYISLEKLFMSHIDFTNPFEGWSVESYDDMERASVMLREKWHLGTNSLPSVCRMLEKSGVKVLEIESDDKFDGLCGRADGSIPFIVLRKGVTVERKRFTALHELAHLLFDSIEELPSNIKERMCHRFASSMLLPLETVRTYIGMKRTRISVSEFATLRTDYGISVAATVHRLKDLGVISEDYYNYIYDERIKKNIMEEGWGRYCLNDEALRYESLVQRSFAEGVSPEAYDIELM